MTLDEMTIAEYQFLTNQGKKISHHGQPEFDDQCAVFGWRQNQLSIYPELKYLFSTLNGVRISIGVATKMKRAGMTRGVLDIWLPARREPYCGLVIELKVGRNTPSEEQLDWIAYLNSQGYYACAKWGYQETINTIIAYLERKLK